MVKYLLTSKACQHCAEAKQQLKNEIKSGEVKVVDINSSAGLKLIRDLDLKAIPKLIECAEDGCAVIE